MAKGKAPKNSEESVKKPSLPTDEGHLLLSFRHLQPRFGVEQLSEAQQAQFLIKWAKRCAFTWRELTTQKKHGLGFEMLPRKQIKPSVPEALKEEKYMVFRHGGNHPFAGFKAGDTFYVLWIEARYNDLYNHGK